MKRIRFPVSAGPLTALLIVAGALGCAHRPPASRPQGAEVASIVVPFELVHDVIIFQGSMRGTGPYNFLLDTGANPSAVDLSTARSAHLFLDEARSGVAEGAGGDRVTIFAARIDALVAGQFHADNIDAVAVDLSAIGRRLGIPLHAVLGYSFLAGRVLQIDYAPRTITFLPSDWFPSPRLDTAAVTAVSLPLEFPSGETIPLLASFQVNGKAVPVTLDTGSSLTLELAPADAALVGLRVPSLPPGSDSAVGARGSLALTPAQADSIGIGSLTVLNPTVHVSPRLQEATYRHGNLGNGFLKEYVLTLDYLHRRLVLERATP